MKNINKSPLTTSKLAKLLTNKISSGELTGNEMITDIENNEWCLMGFTRKGPRIMLDFEEDNEEYLELLKDNEYGTPTELGGKM